MLDLSTDERARAFAFDGTRAGCLLLHGFTGTPAEMRPLGVRLAERGFAVRAPLLPGHGARVEALATTRWQDWYGAALEAWTELGGATPVRVVGALSMGCLLALHLAHDRAPEVRAAALLAPALELANSLSATMATFLARFPLLPRRIETLQKRVVLGRTSPAYDAVPLRALASMIDLQCLVRSELASITTPALIVEGGRDVTISARSASAVETGLGSTLKRRMRFPASGHILTEDEDAEAVIGAVVSFFEEQLAAR